MVESASSQFCKIISIVRFCARFCGADITKPNYRWNWLTYLVFFAIFLAFGCTVYTIYVGVIIDKDWTVILQSSAMVASGLQGLSKLVAVLSNVSAVTSIQTFYQDIYQEYENKGGVYRECLYKRCRIIWRLIVAFMWVYLMVMGLVIALPMFYLIIKKEKLLVMQFLVPGIDYTTEVGYFLLLGIHIICVLFGGFGNFGGDMYLVVFITNLPLLKDLARVKIYELNKVVVHKNSHKEMSTLMWDLLAWHQSYVSVLRRTEKIFKTTMFVQLFTSCGAILCSISCIFLGVWPAAPVYLIYSFIGLYTFCGLGTVVENSNEEFANEIYSNCLWYELPVKEEKLIILMLAKAQKEAALTAADIMTLSMGTAMSLTKGIYSYTMMLLTYLK